MAKIKFKSAAINSFELGQKQAELRQARNIDVLGRRFADCDTFTDVTGRVWMVQNYIGISKAGIHQGIGVYYLSSRTDISGGSGYYFRYRNEHQLVAAQTDSYVMLSGLEASEYKRLHKEIT